jgi:hypothetical protein
MDLHEPMPGVLGPAACAACPHATVNMDHHRCAVCEAGPQRNQHAGGDPDSPPALDGMWVRRPWNRGPSGGPPSPNSGEGSVISALRRSAIAPCPWASRDLGPTGPLAGGLSAASVVSSIKHTEPEWKGRCRTKSLPVSPVSSTRLRRCSPSSSQRLTTTWAAEFQGRFRRRNSIEDELCSPGAPQLPGMTALPLQAPPRAVTAKELAVSGLVFPGCEGVSICPVRCAVPGHDEAILRPPDGKMPSESHTSLWEIKKPKRPRLRPHLQSRPHLCRPGQRGEHRWRAHLRSHPAPLAGQAVLGLRCRQS